MDKKLRLDKYIASMGYGSRKDVKIGIRKGQVRVNDNVIKDPGFQVAVQDKVIYKDQQISYEAYQYYMMHKPGGCITATEDSKQETVLDLMKKEKRKDLFPVGRLDKDTEGLLLITNDGDLCHNLLAPKKHVDKTYFARISGIVTDDDVKAFKEGVIILDDYKTLPATLEVLVSQEVSEINITIREGKFHQIKEMFKARGHEVIYLKRLSMGSLKLDPNLGIGDYRVLTSEELDALKV